MDSLELEFDDYLNGFENLTFQPIVDLTDEASTFLDAVNITFCVETNASSSQRPEIIALVKSS